MSGVESAERAETDVPLVVDLDGTLVLSDTLFESAWRLLLKSPLDAIVAFSSLRNGKGALKEAISGRLQLDVSLLPYDQRIVRRLLLERRKRRVVLCTGAHQRVAKAVAEHLGLFDEVLASSHVVNVTGAAKAALLVSHLGERGFDYVGNDHTDLVVFRSARNAWAVNPTRSMTGALHSVTNLVEHEPREHSRAGALLRALRPHQWLKNILVFIPLLTATGVDRLEGLRSSVLGFAAFSLVASAVYLLNDLIDIDADRQHPRKRSRPIASGKLSIPSALLAAVGCLSFGVAIAISVSPLFVLVLGGYVAVTTAYMLRLKRVPILDSIVLATLYTIRVVGGAAALAVFPSFWLLAFAMFFFMSLALGKRYAEMVEIARQAGGHTRIPGREYRASDLPTLLAQGNATGVAAVVVLALYVHGGLAPGQYRSPELLWGVCPLLLYWISKFWLNAQREEINDDPVIWAATNRVSLGLVSLSLLLVIAARWMAI